MPTPNTSIYHPVPIMIQAQTWACWYTCFQMLVTYERRRGRGGNLKQPSEVAWVKAIYDANQGIGALPPPPGQLNDERERVAKALGFEVLYASVSADGIWEMMNAVPLIYAGRWPNQLSGHWVALVGISQDDIAIHNPLTGLETRNYNQFAGQYLLQTAERPLIYPPY